MASTTAKSYMGTTEYASTGYVGKGNTSYTENQTFVTRYAFKTGNSGATSISFQTANATDVFYDQTGADSIAKIRYVISSSATAYINKRSDTAGKAIGSGYTYGSNIRGSVNINLLPNTTYYLWIIPTTVFAGRFALGGCTVTFSGAYGPSTINASNGAFGDQIPITLNALISGVTHDVSVTCAGRTDTIATGSPDTSFTWTPDLNTYAALIPAANSATATISVTTHNGSATYGTNTRTITVSFKDTDLNPQISTGWVTLAADNSNAVSAAGQALTIYIQDVSKLQATFDSGKISFSDTELDEYSVTVIGQLISGASPLTSNVLGTDGTLDVVATVKDKRGHTASETIQITVETYFRPRIVESSIFRSDSSGVPSASETHISGIAAVSYPSLDGHNTVKLYLAARSKSGTFPTNGEEMTAGQVKTIHGFSAAQSWIGRIRAIDILGNITDVTDLIPPAVWALKITQSAGVITGAGIGMAPSTSKVLELPSDWNIKVGSDYLFYNAGDSVSGAFAVFGWITSGAVAVVLHVVIPRIIKSGLTFTASSLTCAVRKDDGGYIGGSENVDLTTSISECLVTQSGLRITLRGSSAWGINNTPVTGSISLTGAFS